MLSFWLPLIGGLLLLTTCCFVVLHYERRARMLYGECVSLNARWRVACDVLLLRAIRDASTGKVKWDASDDEVLRLKILELEATGTSLQALGISVEEAHECAGRQLH